MDEEMRKLCEEYAWAWYFDLDHRFELQNTYYKKRKEFSSEIKNRISDYFEECRNKNEELLPYKEYFGTIPYKIINLKEE